MDRKGIDWYNEDCIRVVRGIDQQRTYANRVMESGLHEINTRSVVNNR
jgi:hypothetical protein